MKLTLPPRLSPAGFDAAMRDFEGVVGRDWLLATDLDRDAYSDIYAPGSEDEHPPAAAIAPGSVEEVRALVRLANRHRIPLWPVSRGKNLGYGAAAPRMPGTVVLDLGRMRRILEINPELGYCVVEPGVGFFDLYEHIQANDIPLMLSVPGNAWGSVLGNALDRGIGYTPMGNHTRNLCGLEVVLPDGDLVRTGMGAMDGNHAWHCFPYAFGPGLDQLFVQSNMGVVTKAGIWLMPEAQSQLALNLEADHEEDIGWIVDTIAPLKRAGIITQNQFVSSWLGRFVLMGERRQFYDGPGAIPDSRVQELLRQHQLGYWHVGIRLYGDERITRAQADVIKEAFARHSSKPFTEQAWRKGNPFMAVDPSFGVPSAVPLQMGAWTGGRGAHMGFSPVVPPTSAHVLGQLRRSRQRIAEYGVDFYASFTIGDRHANNINMLMFDRDNAEQVSKMRRLFSALVADAKAAGYGEYRTHLSWMDEVAATFDFNDHAQLRLYEKIKDALDPNGVIAPGKQGVWPAAYREQKA
jgi:4-cresol dehydrogenase (hydroxylating)